MRRLKKRTMWTKWSERIRQAAIDDEVEAAEHCDEIIATRRLKTIGVTVEIADLKDEIAKLGKRVSELETTVTRTDDGPILLTEDTSKIV